MKGQWAHGPMSKTKDIVVLDPTYSRVVDHTKQGSTSSKMDEDTNIALGMESLRNIEKA